MDNSDILTCRSWLPLALMTQRNKLTRLLQRLQGIGLRAGTGLGLHRKFLRMLEQVAVEKERELHLLNEIEDIEKLHDRMRRANRLRLAERQPRPRKNDPDTKETLPVRGSESGFGTLLLLFAALHINHKNQSLTVD